NEVGPVIIDSMYTIAEELTIFGHGKLCIINAVRSLAIIGRQVVDAIFHILHRTARDFGERPCNADLLTEEMLAAETSTCIHGVEVYHVRCYLEHTRHDPCGKVQHVGVGPDIHAPTCWIIGADRPRRLHWRCRDARPTQVSFNDVISL